MAIIDARSLPQNHRIESDLCIVGTGAAGLALASEFQGSETRVALLESGGFEADAETTALNAGKIVGLSDAPLDQSRLRYFGGTTNHWTAWVRPFERIDFEARPWVPNSGWPFRIDELSPFYDRARDFLGLPDHAFDVAAWTDAARQPWHFDHDRVETRVLQIVPEPHRRLGARFRQDLEQSANVDVYLHANVLEVVPDEAVKRVRELRVAAGAETRLRARARRYVLAAGGIENARILLLSSSVARAGLGNGRDLVGRYFANHPESGFGAARILMTDAQSTMPLYVGSQHARGTVRGFLRLRDEVQKEAKVANCWLQPVVFRLRKPRQGAFGRAIRAAWDRLSVRGELDDHVVQALRHLDGTLLADEGSDGPRSDAAPRAIALKAFVEPTPNPSSRVRLGEDRDAFGQPRVVLDWRLSELDAKHLRDTLVRLGRELGASELGRLQILFPSGGFDAVNHRGSFHHMGTTRMHTDPGRGVVDANCRIHGISNLFVAGSSVFPTFGTANPTFTILALVFRLADHLRELPA